MVVAWTEEERQELDAIEAQAQENGVVDIELMGACGGCPMSTMTLKAGIERILKDRVEGLNEVRAIGLEDADPTYSWEDEY